MLRLSILLFVVFLSSYSVFSADYVFVTAEKLDSSDWGSAHATSTIETKDQNSALINDVLNFLPGVYATGRGNPGSNGSLYIRGADSSHTLYLLDGVEINDPSTPNRTGFLSNLSLGSLERVEVLRGGQSVLYGSNALGGVVNLITVPEKEGKTLSAAYGNAREHQVSFKQNSKLGKWKYHYSLEQRGDEGISAAHDSSKPQNDLDGYSLFSVHAGASGDLSENQRLEFALRHQRSKQELDFDAYSDETGRETTYKDSYGRLSHSYFASELPFELVSSLAFSDHKRETVFEGGSYNYKGNLYKVGVQGNYYWNKKNVSTLGLEDKREEDRSPSAHLLKKSNDTYSLWGNQHFEYERFFTSLGARFEDDGMSSSRTSYRLAPGYRLPWSSLTLKSVFSTSFRAPTLNQLQDQSSWSGGVTVGNPKLKVERSRQWEVGITHEYAGLTYFENAIKDRLSFAPVTYQNINSGRAKIRGFELEGHTARLKGLALKLSMTKLSTENLETGKELARRPRFQASSVLDYEFEKFKAALEFLYVGERDDSDYSRLRDSSYSLFNIHSSWEKNAFRLWGKLSNILDRDYEEIAGYNSPGRQFMAGLDWNF